MGEPRQWQSPEEVFAALSEARPSGFIHKEERGRAAPGVPLTLRYARRLIEADGGRCLDVYVTDARVPATLCVAADKTFAVMFDHAVAASAGGVAVLDDCRAAVRPLGGGVATYLDGEIEGESRGGVEALSLQALLRARIGLLLRVHALACRASWTAEREGRFVHGRLRDEEGREHDAVAAIAGALSASRHVVLLGDFGTGKSTQLRRLAHLMASSHLKDPARRPCPLLLDLRGMPPDYGAIVAQRVCVPALEVAGLSEPPPTELFRLAVDLGLAVPLFDGLDEMARGPEVADALRSLTAFATDERARDLVSSRRTALGLTDATDAIRAAMPGCTLLKLLEFNDAEAESFVSRALVGRERVDEVLGILRRVHDLKDLGRRPVLLALIVEDVEWIAGQREDITSATLYRRALRRWLKDNQKHVPNVEVDACITFARALARSMFESNQSETTTEEIWQLVVEELKAGRREVDAIAEQMQTAVFVVPSGGDGGFRFAHRSFMEYLLAEDIERRLAEQRADALDLPPLTPEVVAFLAGIDGWDERARRLQGVLRAPYQRRVSENALRVLYHATRQSLAGEISAGEFSAAQGRLLGERLSAVIPRRAALAGATLRGAVLPWVSLPEADLTGADLSLADLSCADLEGASFAAARAQHATFDGADLGGAGFERANLFAASFIDARLTGTRWTDACLDGTVWLGTADLGAALPRDLGGDVASALVVVHEPSKVDFNRARELSLDWSPDGRWIARSCGNDVQIMDVVTGATRATLRGHDARVISVAWSPTGGALATSSWDRTVRLWDARSGAPRKTLAGHGSGITMVAWSADGESLASSSWDCTVRLWSAQTGLAHVMPDDQPMMSAAVTWGWAGDAFASSYSDGTIRLWNSRTRALDKVLAGGHDGIVTGISFSPNGDEFASASADGGMKIWNVHTGAPLRVLTGHATLPTTIAWSPRGDMVASAHGDGTVQLWNARAAERIRTLSSHTDVVTAVAWSPDGEAIASASWDHTVRTWNARDGALVKTFPLHASIVTAAAWAPTGELLASAAWDRTVRLWDLRTGALLRTCAGHSDVVTAVTWASTGDALASGSNDGTVRVWEAATGASWRTFTGHAAAVTTVAWAPGGDSLASASADGTLCVWEARASTTHRTLAGRGQALTAVAWAPDGSALASATADGAVRIWDASSGAIRHDIDAGAGAAPALAWSPDGATLAVASTNGEVQLRDPYTGATRSTFIGRVGVEDAPDLTPDLVAPSMAWAPSGEVLACAFNERSLRLWDVRSGKLRAMLSGHAGTITAASWSPAGDALASSSADGTLRVWRASDGRCLCTLMNTDVGWFARVGETPFFFGEGNVSKVLRLVVDLTSMPASLWAPLFHRPDLVERALRGDLASALAELPPNHRAARARLRAKRRAAGLCVQRYDAPSGERTAPPRDTTKVRLLFLAASPTDLPRLDVGQEYAEVVRLLRASPHGDRYEIDFSPEVAAGDLSAELQRHAPNVVHFSGHGSAEGALFLRGAGGLASPVSAAAMARLFELLSARLAIRCVVLNACYSQVLAEALAEHVDCVIGMPTAVADRTALAFAARFYEELGFGNDLAAAFRLALAQVDLTVPDPGGLPRLHCRPGVDASEIQLLSPEA